MQTTLFNFSKKYSLLVGLAILMSMGLSMLAPGFVLAQEDNWRPNEVTPEQWRKSENKQITEADNGTAAATVSQRGDPTEVEWGCNILTGAFAGCFTAMLYYGMQSTGKLATWAGRFLNTVVMMLVIQMSQFVGAGAGGEAIEHAWSILRDVANVLLVFITIFIGLATIVGVSGYGYKQMLFKVVLAALFVNFSITLAKVVIDTSNLVAIAIYGELTGGACLTEEALGDEYCLQGGVSGLFMEELKIQNLLGQDQLNTYSATTELQKQLQWISALGMIMFLVLAFVFALAAALILIRFFVLTLLIVLSPIGLVVWITGVGGVGRVWWRKLLNQSFFLPAMFLMWLLGLRMLQGLRPALYDTDAVSYAEAVAAMSDDTVVQNVNYFGIFIFFALTIAVLLYSLTLAKSMGAVGANAVINTGNTWAKRAGTLVGAGVGGATLGAAAYAGRRTLGRWAGSDENDERTKNLVSSNNMLKRGYGRVLRAGSKKLANASFDARALAGKDAKKWVGGGKKGGYTQWRKDRDNKIDEENKWTKSAKPTSQEVQERDKAIENVDKKYSGIRNADTNSRLDERLLATHNEVGSLRSRIAEEVDLVQRANLERQLAEKEQEQVWNEAFKDGVARQETLRREIKDGMTEDGHGAQRGLSKDEVDKKKEELVGVTKALEGSYGFVDENVRGLDQEIEKSNEKLASLNGKEAETMKKHVADLKKQREVIIKYHEANRAFMQIGDDETGKTLADAEAELAKLESTESRGIDTALRGKASARGAARSDQYINRLSTHRRFLGMLPPSAGDREKLMGLREKQGKEKLQSDIEKLIKETIAKEEGEKTVEETVPSSTSPSTTV